MQAIQVKFLPPTNIKPARVKAWGFSNYQAVLNWDFNIDDSTNIENAARSLLKKLNWRGPWQGGQLPGGNYAFVSISGQEELTVSVNV
jgi:hypothetical protein